MILNPLCVNWFSLLSESFKSSLSVLDFWYFLMICLRVSLFLSNSGFSCILSMWKHILQFWKNFRFLCSSILERCLLDHLNLASNFLTFFFLIFYDFVFFCSIFWEISSPLSFSHSIDFSFLQPFKKFSKFVSVFWKFLFCSIIFMFHWYKVLFLFKLIIQFKMFLFLKKQGRFLFSSTSFIRLYLFPKESFFQVCCSLTVN